ncbi:hypothetical protein [Sphingomonas sp. Leaf357]|uniref:hypothetical protein n=1 Tax=Sphingomonas sp. Leaf357 TaxID=1736350 RepID=UPI000A451BE4|nr:hypothetical protein [Sphingomonas sp. Leaf357]
MEQETTIAPPREQSATGWLKREAGPAILLACAMVCAAGATALAYRPGLMTWDAIRQYDQALSGEFDDWHPPAMEWLWRQFVPLHAGPAPMLALQLALFWGGLAMLAAWALRRERRGLAVALVACGMVPLCLALMGAVLKDCLMAGTLLAVTGLLAWRIEARGHRAAILAGLALLLLIATATLRFNAFLAGAPVFVALMPEAARRTKLRLAATSLVATAILLAALPVANRLIGARSSGVELSLVIFDLGGITDHSGVDAFPALPGISDPVAVNHRCYSPVKWDPYAWWVEDPCPIGFETVGAALKARHIGPYAFHVRAILAHPLAYAEHRLAHFNINTRFLVADEIERPVQVEGPPNDWGYHVTPNAILSAIDAATLASAHTPLGWPIVWIALAFGVLTIALDLPSRRIVVPVALSALLYGLGYGVFSVAAELRYHLWTLLAAAIAVVIAGSDVFGGAPVSRDRLALAAAPAMIVTILCIVWRVT